MNRATRVAAWLCAAAALLAGCASDVRRDPVDLAAAAGEQGRRWSSSGDVEVMLESRYTRRIAAGTEFVVAGRIAQGLVLKPTQTVLTVEGAHVHEAYAVHRDGQLVGFYLPVERAFTSLVKPVPMPLQERTHP